MDKSKFGSIPFIPGVPPTSPELLARYLPPIPNGIVSTWVQKNLPPGSWLIDPFGASSRLPVEAAQAGYRVLVTANNPIARFLIEIEAAPPSALALKAALAELAASFVGNDRMEPHIRALYSTYCAHCGQIVSADAFLWEHDKPSPYARIYTCPSCGDSGEHPCTPYDSAQTSKYASSGLHRARALERVVAYNDQDRIHVEQALSVYNARALDALITIINKFDGLNLSTTEQKHLAALLLYAFDQANSMWRPQGQGDRHRQLTIPRHYRENNIWHALEEGISKIPMDGNVAAHQPVAVTTWPSLPPETGGICIYEGRLVSIIESIKNLGIRSLCAAIPRPNQPFWTLSALWAGWLWGREAVGKFKSVLHRQRYDWAWHTTALSSVFKLLASFLEPGTPIFGLIGEAEPGFIGSTLIAAGVSGCRLDNIAIRPEQHQAQVTWQSGENREISPAGASLTQIAARSARLYLELNGEPASYLSTIAAALSGIINYWQSEPSNRTAEQNERVISAAKTSQTIPLDEVSPSFIYSTAYNSSREALSYRSGFLQYNLQDETEIEATPKTQNLQGSLFTSEIVKMVEVDDESTVPEILPIEDETTAEKERPTRSSDVTESTLLWLRETGKVNHTTSSDIYEAVIVNCLVNHPGSTWSEINRTVCAEFPGLFTPEEGFIRLCMQSYGINDPDNADRWFIRPEDSPDERRADIANVYRSLHQIGTRLGFNCTDQTTRSSMSFINWKDMITGQESWFFITTHASIGEIVLYGDQPPIRGYIVYPGSRANLLVYKLRRDPRMNRVFNPSLGTWRFLKFRHLRSLAESPMLNRENMDQMLSLDPLTFTTPQLWLI